MSYGSSGYPDGFIANMKLRFKGDIPAKIWKEFRLNFSKTHAPGWKVKKLFKSWRGGGEVIVSFQTTSTVTSHSMTPDQWEFLAATLSMLAVQA